MDNEAFVEVVPAMLLDEAKQHFQQWLDCRSKDTPPLRDMDVRIEKFVVLDGPSRWRYMVRKSALREF